MREPYKNNSGNWTPPDREWLEHQHFSLGKTYKQIAKELDMGKDKVQAWAITLEVSVWNVIPSDGSCPPIKVGTGSGTRFYGVTKEWLEREYFEKGESAHQIAKETGTSWNAIVIWLRKHGLEPRNREEINERHSTRMSGDRNPAWVGGTAQRYQRRILTESSPEVKCSWCHTFDKAEIHHIDHDRDNCDLSNLMWLCGICNKLEAYLWALQKLNRAIVNVSDGTIEVKFRHLEGG